MLDAGQSAYVFCIAKQASGERGVALFSASTEGVSIKSRRMMDFHSAGSIRLDGVPAEDIVWLTGDDVEGGIQQTIDQATMVLAAEMVGSAKRYWNVPWPTSVSVSSSM